MPSSLSVHLDQPFSPLLLVAVVVLALLAFVLYRRTEPPLDARLTGLLLGLRLVAIALLAFLLLEPILSIFNEKTKPPRIAVLLDRSLSMAIPFPEESPDAAAAETIVSAEDVPTRSSRMQEVFGDGGNGLSKELKKEGELEVYAFGGALTPVNPELAEDPFDPTEDRTDLSRALTESVSGRRRETGAVVILTDGSHNVGVDPRQEAGRLGVPVFTVGVGSDGRVTDVSVFEVTATGVAYLDNDVPVRARVRARGDSVRSVPVYLSEGDAILDSTVVSLPGGGGEVDVEMKYVPRREGLHRYRVWTPEVEGEISTDNNENLFVVRVLKEKIKVLLVTGAPNLDFTFTKRALESDVSLAVEAVVLSLRDFPGRLGREGTEFPASYAELAPYDLVVLLDVEAERLGAEGVESVARFVTQRGGALLIMGPPRAFQLAGTKLEEVLPVRVGTRARSRSGQILPRLTAAGKTHPVTQLDRDAAVNERLWDELPPLGVAPIFLEPKPGARVLVRGMLDGMVRDELSLVATTQQGRGRVLAVCGGPYWRWDLYLWGTGRSGDLFRRFMSRSVRWLVSRDELRQVMVRPVKNLFDGAEGVVLEGQVFDDDFRPVTGADVSAIVRGPLGEGEKGEQKERRTALVDLGDGRYRSSLAGLPPGDYEIEGSAALGGTELGTDGSEMTVAPYRMEFEDPSPDFELLREMSRASGGAFLTLDETDRLPDALDLEPIVDRSVRELPFLENPWIFLVLLGLLGTEWGLRKARGLP